MTYKALYRKYRPATFEEVVGQQHVVLTLQNAIKNNKLAHAYLFCGPRGTGKTTIAKLLAKTINCESDGHRPCGKCSSCIDIQESSHPDVVELDAATNNGVDQIRDLVDRVKYAPMKGRYKVYIIDEVHMMTSSAFNALLKTLEEPPEYCIFILATTEPQKVLPTIISRCQRFDFTKVPVALIKGQLQKVAGKENITIDDEALDLIAEIADGGMRDALSILDQCIAYAQNNIHLKDVNAVYGITTTSEKLALLDCIKNKDMSKLIASINEIDGKGVDIARLTLDLMNLCKEAVIYSYAPNPDLLNRLSPAQAQQLLDDFSASRLLRYIDYLMEADSKYRGSTDSLSYLEVCLLKMMAETDQPAAEKPAEKAKPVRKAAKPVASEPDQPLKPAAEDKPAQPEKTAEVRQFKRLNDQQIYTILIKATKACKEKDAPLWEKLLNSPDAAAANLKGTAVMAESSTSLIITADTRIQADNINEEETNNKIEQLIAAIYPEKKTIFAVTKEEASYLITYFKQRQSQPAVEQPVKEEPAPAAEQPPETDVMTSLFGADGFETRKD